MPIPLGYSRSTFYGHLPQGEIFNWSLWANEAPIGQAAAQTQANAFRDKFVTDTATGTSPRAILGPAAGYDGVRVYSYENAGGKASAIGDASMSQPGNSGASAFLLPNQLAVCVTLLTAAAGRTAKGRVYLPLNQLGLSLGGQLDSTTCTALATWMSLLITHLNSTLGTQKIGVLSQKTGTFHAITSVAVDSKMDIQRRRANKQPATNRAIVAVA